MRKLLTLLVLLTLSGPAFSQMLVDTDTLYGNEWINYDQSYYKIPVSKDGLYRLDAETLQQAGIVLSELSGDRLRLHHMGQEVPIHISSTGSITAGDYLLFWGKQNRGEFDTHLFEDPAENQLNPLYSLVTDTSAYYLTWGDAPSSTRLQTIDSDLTNPPAKEEWIWQQVGEVFTEKFMKNYTRRSGITIYFSHYDVAEGYGNRNINELLQSGNTTQDFSLNLPDAYIGGPSARFTARFGVGEGDHRQLVQIDGGTYFERSYNDISVKAPDFSFPLTDDDIEIRFEGQADDRDEQSIAFYQVDYPSLPDARNQKVFEFEVAASNTTKYLEIADFNSSNGTPVIYDLTNGLRILCRFENGIVKALLPPSTEQRSLVLLEEASAEALDAPQSINFPNLLSQTTEFLILTAPELRETYENQDQVQAYADYRASAAGGNYKTQIVEVEDIYHQFGYGLDRHPQSIRNFVHAAHRQWPNLKYVFIIGKGREYPSLRLAAGLANAIEAETFFVPSFGFPASDNLMLSNNSSSVAVVPVGRIAATNPKEISIYLRKVETLEATVNNGQTIEERAWMKNIIHLGGGGSSGEQNAIKSNLERMAREIEGNIFGGKVTPFYKTSTDPIQQSRSQQIFDRINEGTAVITFFGHSSPGTFDFNIDNPDNYDNFGKFPLIMSLGCYSGNFFTSSKGIAERFTFYEDRASVAFGASRGVGFISTLGGFADRFYEKMGGEKYGQGIGDIISATRESFDYLTGLEIKTIVQQFSLMGDPSIRLHPNPGPDYVVDRSSVQFSPKVISIQEDSFQLEFDVLNLGQFIQDSITVDIRQKLPGGEELKLKSLRIATPAYASHHTINLPTQGKASIGLNTFFIDVDVQNEVDELPAPSGEMNNSLVRGDGQAGVPLFMIDNITLPIYPVDYALVNSEELKLHAATSKALVEEKRYRLEIDTTEAFNSFFKISETLEQIGGLISWSPELALEEGQVYYWRISPDSTDSDIGFIWETSSFTYLPETTGGWGQGHRGQWLKGGQPNGLDYSTLEPLFDFDFLPLDMLIKNNLWEGGDRPGFIYNNGGFAGSVRPWIYSDEAVAVMVGIPRDGHFWANAGAEYGSVDASGRAVFTFPVSTEQGRRDLINFIEETVPDGFYIYLFTVQKRATSNLYVDQWGRDSLNFGTNIFQVLEEQGANHVRLLEERGSVPYAFMYQKGVGPLDESVAVDVLGTANVGTVFRQYQDYGTYRSPLIGPVRNWQRLEVDLDTPLEGDTTSIHLFGITVDGESVLLKEDIRGDLELDLIDEATYPYLQLEIEAKTMERRIPRQVRFLHLLYESLPECAVAPSLGYQLQSDTLFQGAPFSMKVVVANVSDIDMDSLLVDYTLTDSANNIDQIRKRVGPLPAGDTLQLNYQTETSDRTGSFQLLLEVNPDEDQSELLHFNNFVDQSFYIDNDLTPPILDVTFDGAHILNGDLVGSDPVIVVQLKDENDFFRLDDTSLFVMQLQYPDGQIRRVGFDKENILFLPAVVGEANTATIEYSAHFEQSGQYKLIVSAKDVNGNNAGAFAYEVAFEVIVEKMISNVFNYPNPFSTSTQFVYTLTGQAPAFFTVQVMTVSGRVVREISQEEIGPLRVGTHKTVYQWDGTDDFGDQLANGVYFYRIMATDLQGNDYETYQNGTDQYFKNGLGKMVILR